MLSVGGNLLPECFLNLYFPIVKCGAGCKILAYVSGLVLSVGGNLFPECFLNLYFPILSLVRDVKSSPTVGFGVICGREFTSRMFLNSYLPIFKLGAGCKILAYVSGLVLSVGGNLFPECFIPLSSFLLFLDTLTLLVIKGR